MRLLCDEDIGTGVPGALHLVDCDAISLFKQGWAGTDDIFWLGKAGELEWLVFSCNKRMLLAKSERDTIISAKVGIIFLTSGEEHPSKVLKLLLTKWDKLVHIHENISRPFAFFVSPNGRISTKYRNFTL